MVAMIFGGGGASRKRRTMRPPAKPSSQPGKIVRIGPAGDSQISIDAATIDGESADRCSEPELPKHWIGILAARCPTSCGRRSTFPRTRACWCGKSCRAARPKGGTQAVRHSADRRTTRNSPTSRDLTDLVRSARRKRAARSRSTCSVVASTKRSCSRPKRGRTVAGDGAGDADAAGMGPGAQAVAFESARSAVVQFSQLARALPTACPDFNLNQMPNGVSVSIQKQNDEPAHITVKRGNDTWDIVGDDPSSLAQLPDDVRPFVEQMLAGHAAGCKCRADAACMPGMRACPAWLCNGEIAAAAPSDGAATRRCSSGCRAVDQREDAGHRMRSRIDRRSNS